MAIITAMRMSMLTSILVSLAIDCFFTSCGVADKISSLAEGVADALAEGDHHDALLCGDFNACLGVASPAPGDLRGSGAHNQGLLELCNYML